MKRRCNACGKRKAKSRMDPGICVTCMRRYPSLKVMA